MIKLFDLFPYQFNFFVKKDRDGQKTTVGGLITLTIIFIG